MNVALATLRLQDRLNFVLPPFTRFSWVSAVAERLWAPRMSRIRTAWRGVEARSVELGLRDCGLIAAPASEAKMTADTLHARGLLVEIGNRTENDGTTTGPMVELLIGASRREVGRLTQALDAGDDIQIGLLLGYPECCCRFFREVRCDLGCLDLTWAAARNPPTIVDNPREVRLDAVPETNTFWAPLGLRAIHHTACSQTCAESIDVGRRMTALGQRLNYAEEMAWLMEILEWPVQWSALHGIAELKSPVLKMTSRTDATAFRYSVKWEGNAVRQSRAGAMAFPDAPPRRPRLTSSAGYLKGLSNRQDIGAPPPSWFHLDNGFSSLAGMRRSHAPLVSAALKALADQGGAVLDLGCGNGALLQRMREADERIIPFGVDSKRERIAHAKTLMPPYAPNFLTANLFSLGDSFDGRRFDLILLMVGRLHERPAADRIDDLRAWLAVHARMILLYFYPGYPTRESLENLAESAGLRLTETFTPTVGIAPASAGCF